MKDAYICLVIFVGACVYMGNSLQQEIMDVMHQWAHTMEQEDHNHLHSFSLKSDQVSTDDVQSLEHGHSGIQLFQGIFKTKSGDTAQPVLPIKNTVTALQPVLQGVLRKIIFPRKSIEHASHINNWTSQFSTYPECPPPKFS